MALSGLGVLLGLTGDRCSSGLRGLEEFGCCVGGVLGRASGDTRVAEEVGSTWSLRPEKAFKGKALSNAGSGSM